MSVAIRRLRLFLDRDDGSVLLMVAGSLLLLLGIAAIVVDGGMIFNERRQDQSAADVASLAAVQFAKPDPSCGSSSACIASAVSNGASEAVIVANASLDDPTLADWTDPASCSSPPPEYVRVSASPCVAFTENLEKAWVRIPTVDLNTSFGGILGVDTLQTSAQAEAQTIVDSGSILPFLLPGNAANTEYNCLKTSGNPSWGECEDLPTTGNFGSMDLFLYGNRVMGTTIECTGDTNGRLLTNLARGVDHPMRSFVAGGPGVAEANHCPIFSAQPNMALGQPGVGSSLDPGLTYGGSVHSTNGPYPGRLSRGGNRTLVRGSHGSNPATRIDDTPLWDYLVSFPSGDPCGAVVDVISMRGCLAAWTLADGIIFEDSIGDAVRFGFVPQMWEDDFGPPGIPYHIRSFRPVYLDTTLYACSAITCDVVHTPGISGAGLPCLGQPTTTCGVPGSGNDQLNAVTAFILQAEMLPEDARYPYPGDPNQLKYQLTR